MAVALAPIAADCTSLGCGSYSAAIRWVGCDGQLGATVLDVTNALTRVRWERVLNDVSNAEIEIALGGSCCARAGEIRPVFQELALYRDGREVWVGPIREANWTQTAVTLKASDLLWHLKGRILDGYDLGGQPTDLGDLVALILADAFPPGSDPNVAALANGVTTGIAVEQSYEQSDYVDALTALLDLASLGLDFTVYGRELRYGREVPTGDLLASPRLPTLTDAAFVNGARVTDRGDLYATDVVVVGEDGIVGRASVGVDEVDDCYRRTIVIPDSSLRDQTAADAAAEAALSLSFPVPGEIDAQNLLPTAPICEAQLIPGALGVIQSAGLCREGGQELRLSRVQFGQTGTAPESVAVSFEPVGDAE